MSRKMRPRNRAQNNFVTTAVIKDQIQSFDDRYGAKIKALSAVIKAHGDADKHITNFWHKPENNIGIPAWERAWSDKFADDMDIIIGSAKENGLDPEEYLGCFLAACDDPNFDLRRDLSDLLPWRLKMAVK